MPGIPHAPRSRMAASKREYASATGPPANAAPHAASALVVEASSRRVRWNVARSRPPPSSMPGCSPDRTEEHRTHIRLPPATPRLERSRPSHNGHARPRPPPTARPPGAQDAPHLPQRASGSGTYIRPSAQSTTSKCRSAKSSASASMRADWTCFNDRRRPRPRTRATAIAAAMSTATHRPAVADSFRGGKRHESGAAGDVQHAFPWSSGSPSPAAAPAPARAAPASTARRAAPPCPSRSAGHAPLEPRVHLTTLPAP